MQKKIIISGSILVPVFFMSQVEIKKTSPNVSLHMELASISVLKG